MINIVLVEPEIPQNAGNIVRTCAAIGAKLYMVKPLGFIMDDKHFKRAEMDYKDFIIDGLLNYIKISQSDSNACYILESIDEL